MATATYASRRMGRTPKAAGPKMGNWKMAYADFLTALMAFFLVMWLVSGVPAEDRAALADYFNAETSHETVSIAPYAQTVTLLESLKAHPIIQSAGESIDLIAAPHGLRIEIIDREARPLFQTGQIALSPDGVTLLQDVASLIAPLELTYSIEGHTDAFTPPRGAPTNWELSTGRANSARNVLVTAGLSDNRLKAVSGLAATRPLKRAEPHLSSNRRITIVLHSADQTL